MNQKLLPFLAFILLAFTGNGQVAQGTLLSTWSDASLPGSAAFNNTYNEIWGYEINGIEYAIIGSTNGTHFIDVTDPENIFEAHFVEGAHTGPAIIHRDYHDHNGYLYAVADEGNSTLQIMDLTTLPDSINVIYDSDEIIRQAHNIFIDETQDRLYALSHKVLGQNFAPLKAFDISDPLNPVELGVLGSFDGFNVGHVHDAFIDDHIGYLNCGNDGFAVVDLSDMTAPVLLGSMRSYEYPQSGYNHSGWPSEDRSHYYMADETWDKDMKVLDLTNLPDIMVTDTIDAGSESQFSIAHNQLVAGDYLYVAYYYEGLQVYDISNMANPVRVMHFPTTTLNPRESYEGAWGVYPFLPSGNILVSDMQNGLFVIDNPANISSVDDQIWDELSIYPNPATDIINIELPDGEFTITVTDMFGRTIDKIQSVNNFSHLDVFNYVNGMHLISIQNIKTNKRLTEKIVILR